MVAQYSYLMKSVFALFYLKGPAVQNILKMILTSRVYDAAQETPLELARGLSKKVDNNIWLKREDLQPVFSFKIRGAYNRIAQLSAEEKKRGVIAASAGNHAQGVAFSAQLIGISAVIVMPLTTPAIKVAAVRGYGAEVVLHGDNYSEAADHCDNLIEQSGRVFIHPFDDDHVIAGQGTVADEILRQSAGRLDAVFVPVGGGGLIAGIASYIKAVCPEVKVIGVEPEDSAAMSLSLERGHRVKLDNVGIFADGVAVREVGARTFELCRRHVDEMIQVTTDEICSGIKTIYQETRSIAEPAGALAVAGLKKYIQNNNLRHQHLVAVNSGANMNFDRLRFVAERTQIGEKKEALYAVTIPERPGALRHFCTHLLDGQNITEFNYRLADRERAYIFVGLSVRDTQQRHDFFQLLTDAGYDCLDMTDNDLAKTHIRYMVGGHSHNVVQEHLYRFWFPERPGALARFLAAVGSDWNISLFHYRAQGGDFGRVLVGLELPGDAHTQLNNFLSTLGYYHIEETDNPAYKRFLYGG